MGINFYDLNNDVKNVKFMSTKINNNKTDAERRQTLGHPRSINPNMINHVPQQSPLIF